MPKKFTGTLKAFSLIEILVVIAIIGVMAAVITVATSGARAKARDAKRKMDISQIGRFLAASCFLPASGGGEYDLLDVANQMVSQNPQYSAYLSQVPKDPKSGSDTQSNYRYLVTNDGKRCALAANLENENEPVTLPAISAPTAGGGTGVLNAANPGWNGTGKYFQISN